ncbi:MAG: anion permease, partial [Alphaproteobacteria bacterium]|nr:anion permease [Alphaproteobacteria bacterium]
MDATAAAAVETRKSQRVPHFASLVICLLVPLLFWLSPLPIDAVPKQALAVTLFMVLAWITEPVDHAITGLIGCFLYWVLGMARFEVAFSGFANDTTWFLFGATLMGAMASKSGLAKRLAYAVMRRVGTTYPRLLLGLIITDFLLTLIVPSGIARIVIMAAVALGLVEALKLPSGSNGARGIFLIITYTAALFDKMIIAGASAITARGLIEKIGEVDVPWSQWFVAFLPCHILTVFAAWRLTLWLFPPEQTVLEGGADYLQGELQKLGPMSAPEFKTAALLVLATMLWVTDFLHHISAAKIGLGLGLAGLLPFVGLLSSEDLKKTN